MKLLDFLKPGGLASVAALVIAAFAFTSVGVSREVPVGSVSGVVTMNENHKPLEDADVVLSMEDDNGWEQREIWRTKTDEQGHYVLRNVPARKYLIHVYGRVHQALDKITVNEGKGTTKDIGAERDSPYVQMNAGSRVYSPGDDVQLRFSGLSDSNDMEVRVFEVTPQAIRDARNVSDLLYSVASGRNRRDPMTMASLKNVQTVPVKINTRDKEGVFVMTSKVAGLPTGIYLLQAKTEESSAFSWLTVTTIGMVTKTDNDHGVAYVTDLKTGKPVDGATIRTYSEAAPETSTTVKGVAEIKGWQTSQNQRVVLVSADYNGSPAYTWFYDYNNGGDQYESSTVYDRTIYRPGDVVHVKTTIRKRVDQTYVLPDMRTARYELEDESGEPIAKQDVTLDEFGSVHASFKIPEFGETGSYSLNLKYGKQTFYEYVPIASYRKPAFEVKVSPVKDSYIRGDKVKFLIECTSLTGEPVPGAKVDASLSVSNVWAGSPYEDDYDPYWADDMGDYGNYVAPFEAVTDDLGRAVIEFDPRDYHNEDDDYVDHTFILNASVEDAGGHYFEGSGKVMVKRGECGLNADFSSYFTSSGHAIQAKIVADGNTSVFSGRKVEYEFGRMVYGDSEQSFDMEAKGTLDLSGGTGLIDLTPRKEGEYQLRVFGFDTRGNRVAARAWIWVSGFGDVDEKLPALRLIPDKDTYLPGDTAQVLVQCENPGGSVLVTVEGEGLISSTVVDTLKPETRVEVPIDKKMVPNVTVTASRIYDKHFMTSSRTLKIGRDQETLKVDITPDKSDVRPGETVVYTVNAHDEKGRPVKADVAFGVVDEGIYLIKEDHRDPLDDFYFRRWTNVSTNYSFPEIYLDGDDKSGANVDIRTQFKDTAFWNPSVRTDANGEAKVTVKLPDNLTAWRATATAITADTRAGKGSIKVVAKLPVMARISAPQFMVEGDVQSVVGYVVNGSKTKQTVKVEMTATGGKLTGPPVQTLTLDPDETGKVTWTATPNAPGTMDFKLTAIGEKESDGVLQKVPVKALGVQVRDQRSFSVDPTQETERSFDLKNPVQNGVLTVTVSPDIPSALEDSVNYLTEYPYGCVEQTMSRFVPAVMLRSFMRERGRSTPELEKRTDDVIRIGKSRIESLQLGSGMWGWFDYSTWNAEMTAYALTGLKHVQDNGVEISKYMIDNAVRGSDEVLKKPVKKEDLEWQVPRLMRLSAALLLWSDDATAIQYLQTHENDKYAHVQDYASIVIGLNAFLKRAPNSDVVKAMRDRCYARVKKTMFGAGQTLSVSDIFDEASSLQAMIEVEGATADADKLMADIMSKRNGTRWDDTWRTSAALLAAVPYLEAKNAQYPSGNMEVTVMADGVAVDQRTVSLDDPKGLTYKVPLTKESGTVSVKTRMQGTGNPYVSAVIEGFSRDNNPQPLSLPPGFKITREYFKVESVRLENGYYSRETAKKPTDLFKAGEVFRCRLTIETPAAVDYVTLEDPIPSNCRIVDTDEPDPGFDWTNWWDKSSFYDDRAVFFTSTLQKGKSVIEYAIRAEATGQATALQARAYPMYQADAKATTRHFRVEVKK